MDLLQIEKKGNLTKTVQLMHGEKGSASGEAKVSMEIGKQSALKQIFDSLIGMSTNASINAGINGNITGERVAKTILENTLIYDFLDTVEFRKKKPIIDISDGFKLNIQQDTMTYFATITPIASMFEGSKSLEDEDLTFDVSKMNEAIKNIKGYFELIGTRGKENRVFRFNIESFKNNYRIQDLKFMNLTLYSVLVGEISKENLKFDKEFDLNQDDKPSGIGNFGGIKSEKTKLDKYQVYDVILAGVK
ncbi:DUF6414 family protein [Macrococcoides caseolyticum]|uniref:DUF6414 family protein n=1 Tax=Macrococcoides caseolyticum TaxID=69966 RepID=UPI000C34BF73|nr:DUF6414 family protein [Macrococcus caseolyticus]PKE62540.1 hypothetical protein CW683_10080 [Macrococcus caseolyticus]